VYIEPAINTSSLTNCSHYISLKMYDLIADKRIHVLRCSMTSSRNVQENYSWLSRHRLATMNDQRWSRISNMTWYSSRFVISMLFNKLHWSAASLVRVNARRTKKSSFERSCRALVHESRHGAQRKWTYLNSSSLLYDNIKKSCLIKNNKLLMKKFSLRVSCRV
jgi:hypothetical protein